MSYLINKLVLWWSTNSFMNFESVRITRRSLPFLSTVGFTLIELLVVIAIIGILAAVVLIAINPGQRIKEARDSQRRSDLAQIRNALEAYAVAHGGQYPITNGWRCDDCGSYDPGNTTWTENNWIPGLVSLGYLKKLPKDPENGQNVRGCAANNSYGYIYASYAAHPGYKLMAHCTVNTSLNHGAPSAGYCPNRSAGWNGGYDDSYFDPTPGSGTTHKLNNLVDPVRFTYAYSVYSPNYTCL